ncbi:hypothetical protein EB001_13345 [bacterium]|nr:hypothetical protein [bacterium]
MKLTFIFLLFVSFVFTSFTTSAKDRWVRDKGAGTIEVVVNTTPSTPAPVIVIATNATTIPVTITTNKTPTNVVVYQQTNWPVKVNATAGFQKPVEYKAIKVAQQEPRQKRPGFLARFFGPSQPMMTDAISQSSLPANPVRRSYRSFTLPTASGTYNYSHYQGTDTYAEKSWDDYGPREVMHQSTYVSTSESFYPETRRWIAPTYYQNTGVQARTVTWP